MPAVLSSLRGCQPFWVTGVKAHMYEVAIPFNKLPTSRSRKQKGDDNDDRKVDLAK